MLNLFFIFLGFFFLIQGANLLIDGAASLAKKFNVSDLVIGLTIVAFGTSAPEFFVNMLASLNGNSGLAFGNIAGSVIANILLVMGIASFIMPLAVAKGTVWREIPFAFFSTILLVLFAFFPMGKENMVLSRMEGMVFLCFFILFLLYSFKIAGIDALAEDMVSDKNISPFKSFFFIIFGLIGLLLGGKLIVNAAIKLAIGFGISDTIIGLTIVAVGTCLPELAASVVAAIKKKPDIAVGGIVGSNIFNVFLILGVSVLLNPIVIDKGMMFDIIIMIAASFFLFLSMFTGKRHKIDRSEGLFFIITYFIYLLIRIKGKALL